MKNLLLILTIVLFTSCVSTNKFARSRYKSYTHPALTTHEVSSNDYILVYNTSPNHIKYKLDHKQLKIFKLSTDDYIYYNLINANYRGQIGDRDIVYTIIRYKPKTIIRW